MKSAHRHELETNVLATKLEVMIERYKPYTAQILGGIIAAVALIMVASYLWGSSSSRNSEAWDTYNRAVTSAAFGGGPSLDDLRRTSQENAGTPIQQMADVTWADATVWNAAHGYLANRAKALESLDAAATAYTGVVQSSKDDQLVGRAHLGLARIYEMQNKLDKAKEEYGKVTGALAKYSQAQVDRLNKPDVQETYAWLSTAQVPVPKMPGGPGTPGQTPPFSATDMNLPPAGPAAQPKAEDTKAANQAFDDLLKSLKEESKKGDADRYKDGQKPTDGAAPAAPAGKDAAPAAKDAAPAAAPKSDAKPAEKAAEKPAEKPATPAPEKSAK